MAAKEEFQELDTSEIKQYKITQLPRGTCIIINNVHFETVKDRMGSDRDQNSLDRVFHWLGFDVVIHKDKTAAQIKSLLNDLGKKVNGDCFICCILSHGNSDGVYGTDQGIVSMDEIREPFNGINCKNLAGKPKLFFIQACRGTKNHNSVKVQADDPEGAESELEVDAESFNSSIIPVDSDFLIARSTIDRHYSFRNKATGSWFIQSLCRQLETHCPQGTDIQTILLSVNDEVSREGIRNKQMPVLEVGMRKKLILHVPEELRQTLKRVCLEVEGYIHNVSAVLQSCSGSGPYFTALLQEANKNSRVVVFDIQWHNIFQRAERDRSPMKLTGVSLSPSIKQQNTNDVLVDGRTKVTLTERLPFTFNEHLCMSSPLKSLADIMQDTGEDQMVSVKVKGLQVLDDKEVLVRGQKVRLKSIVVADREHLLLLTVWEQHDGHDLELDMWYRLDNVSIKKCRGMKTLSTTVQSVVCKVEDCGPAREFSELQTVVGDIIAADVQIKWFCPKYHPLDNVDSSTLMLRCRQCNAYCKTDKTTVELRGHISIDVHSQKKKFFLDDAQFRKLLNVNDERNLSPKDLAANIIVHDQLTVQLWREYVMHVSFCEKGGNSSAGCTEVTQPMSVSEI